LAPTPARQPSHCTLPGRVGAGPAAAAAPAPAPPVPKVRPPRTARRLTPHAGSPAKQLHLQLARPARPLRCKHGHGGGGGGRLVLPPRPPHPSG